jgi:hypothetical protein
MVRSPGSSISQLVRLFQNCMNELGRAANQQQLESWAFVVHRAMSRNSRDYHNATHVFVVARGLPALGRLAAIYHDTVYMQAH